jgi:glyoxylase I family protein
MPLPSFFPATNAASPFASWKPDHAGVRAPDFAAAAAWYVETLDFRVVKAWSHGEITFGFLALATDDGFCLELIAGPGVTPPAPRQTLQDSLGAPGWHHLCLRVGDLDATIAELKRRHVTILAEPFPAPAWNARIAFFADPWGNVFELAEVMEG